MENLYDRSNGYFHFSVETYALLMARRVKA